MRILEEFWYGNIEPMLSALKTLRKNFSAVALLSKKAVGACPISHPTAPSPSQHESWVTILIKLLYSQSLSETQNE